MVVNADRPVVAGSCRSPVAADKACASTFRPTERAVVGSTEVRIASCMRNVSVHFVSSPKVSKRKIRLPSAILT